MCLEAGFAENDCKCHEKNTKNKDTTKDFSSRTRTWVSRTRTWVPRTRTLNLSLRTRTTTLLVGKFLFCSATRKSVKGSRMMALPSLQIYIRPTVTLIGILHIPSAGTRCRNMCLPSLINPLIATFKPQNSGPSYSNRPTVVHWPLMGGLLHLVQWRGDWMWRQPAQAPPRCTKCNSSLVNGQCTSFVLFDVAL